MICIPLNTKWGKTSITTTFFFPFYKQMHNINNGCIAGKPKRKKKTKQKRKMCEKNHMIPNWSICCVIFNHMCSYSVVPNSSGPANWWQFYRVMNHFCVLSFLSLPARPSPKLHCWPLSLALLKDTFDLGTCALVIGFCSGLKAAIISANVGLSFGSLQC